MAECDKGRALCLPEVMEELLMLRAARKMGLEELFSLFVPLVLKGPQLLFVPL